MLNEPARPGDAPPLPPPGDRTPVAFPLRGYVLDDALADLEGGWLPAGDLARSTPPPRLRGNPRTVEYLAALAKLDALTRRYFCLALTAESIGFLRCEAMRDPSYYADPAAGIGGFDLIDDWDALKALVAHFCRRVRPTPGRTSHADGLATLRSQLAAALAELPTDRPTDLDDALADAFHAVAVGCREATALVCSLPWLNVIDERHSEDAEEEYRCLAGRLHAAADAARAAYLAVDVRLFRAGGPNVPNPMLDVLKDVLAVRDLASLDYSGVPGRLGGVITRLQVGTRGLFPRVEGRSTLLRMREQLAHVPQAVTTVSMPSLATNIRDQPAATKSKGKNIDARMLKICSERPESHGWTAREWAEHLGCGHPMVVESTTWKVYLKGLKASSAADAASRMEKKPARRRRKPGS